MLRKVKQSLLAAAVVLTGGMLNSAPAQDYFVQYPPVAVAPVYYSTPVVVARPVYAAPVYYSPVVYANPVVYPAPVYVAGPPVVPAYPVLTRTRVRVFPHHVRITTRAW